MSSRWKDMNNNLRQKKLDLQRYGPGRFEFSSMLSTIYKYSSIQRILDYFWSKFRKFSNNVVKIVHILESVRN